MQLVFATNNQHKLEEIDALLGKKFQLLGLKDLHMDEEIPEDHNTLEANASQKAWYIFDRTGQNCFADDTGLEVDALSGAPGVYSARYSRMGHPSFPEMEAAQGNIKKLLLNMEDKLERSARFRTVISLILNGKEYQFEGVVEGTITKSASGVKGFGYDPIFYLPERGLTMAQLPSTEKHVISHRGRALQAIEPVLTELLEDTKSESE